MIVYGRSCQPGVPRVIALLRLGASVGCLRVSLHRRLFLLSPRLSASPAVARGRLPRVAVAVVSVTCRFGGLDAMVPQTLSSLPSMESVDAPALGGLARLPGWLCFASLQSMGCSHVVQPLALTPCSQWGLASQRAVAAGGRGV